MSRTVGVVGTLVWDTFVGGGVAERREDWGGIAYALAALSATLAEGWTILPIIKVGTDLAGRARRFLKCVPRLDASAVVEVGERNNRVELRYHDASRRTERLTGGVPASTWDDLAAPLSRCDALYVNFISGYELDLETARAVADTFSGPTYGDLHSLFLGIDEEGVRVARRLPSASAWLACFDTVQVNEDELALLAGDSDPWRTAHAALGERPRLFLVTLGERGAAYLSGDRASHDPSEPGSGRVTVGTGPRTGDPTGCGDVWGATAFARLLAGDAVAAAVADANRIAGLNVEQTGATGLLRRLAETRHRSGASERALGEAT